MRSVILSGAVAAALTLGLSACTNPYDPGQRAIDGGLIAEGLPLEQFAAQEQGRGVDGGELASEQEQLLRARDSDERRPKIRSGQGGCAGTRARTRQG